MPSPFFPFFLVKSKSASIETFKLHKLKLESRPFNFDVEKYPFSCFILLKRNDIPFFTPCFDDDITLQVYYTNVQTIFRVRSFRIQKSMEIQEIRKINFDD